MDFCFVYLVNHNVQSVPFSNTERYLLTGMLDSYKLRDELHDLAHSLWVFFSILVFDLNR